jgi:hypothetical protein
MHVLLLTLLLALLSSGPAQETDNAALLRRCAKNEVAALERPRPFTFKERTEWSWGSETRDVIETSQGRADRIVAFQDEPLNPDQQRKQVRRLEKLLVNSDDRHEALKEQKEEQLRRLKMARALPDVRVQAESKILSPGPRNPDLQSHARNCVDRSRARAHYPCQR